MSSGGVDHIEFFAVAVPQSGANAVQLALQSFTTAKSDTSDAGTFSLAGPLVPNLPYLNVARPMDLIAIYGIRKPESSTVPVSIGPSVPLTSLRYPVALVADAAYPDQRVISGLRSRTCIFIGMVDHVGVVMTPGSDAGAVFSLNGRDLTKVFLDNDSGVPWDVKSASDWTNFAARIIDSKKSAKFLLETLFDTLVAKKAQEAGETIPNVDPSLLKIDASKYGFPWRNFVDTTLLDPTYFVFDRDNLNSTFMVQGGSAWANAIDIKNEPNSRLFVNEQAQLIFDSQLDAWKGVARGQQTYEVTADVIRVFEAFADDAELGTFISVFAARPVAQGVGAYLLGGVKDRPDVVELTSALYKPATLKVTYGHVPSIQTYGFRAMQFQSLFDLTPASVRRMAEVLIWKYNTTSLYRATLQVKGDAIYRIGQRARVSLGTPFPLIPGGDGQVWYVDGVEHAGQFGNDWSTTLHLRFPIPAGGAA